MGKTSRVKAAIQTRRLKVIQYTIAGASSREISALLISEGFKNASQPTVVRDRIAALKDLRSEIQDELNVHRSVMDARYRKLLLSYWTSAIDKNKDSVDAVLKILKSLRELHGTDEPQKIDHGDNRPVILKVTHERAPAGKKK